MLTSELVKDTFYNCMYDEDVINAQQGDKLPEGALVVDGIIHKFVLDPEKVEKNKQVIIELIRELPDEFMVEGGGGTSFLSACMDRRGVQWTSSHAVMELLFVMGMALGCSRPCLPKVLWPALPGGMPYFVVDTDPDKLKPWLTSLDGAPPMSNSGIDTDEGTKETIH